MVTIGHNFAYALMILGHMWPSAQVCSRNSIWGNKCVHISHILLGSLYSFVCERPFPSECICVWLFYSDFDHMTCSILKIAIRTKLLDMASSHKTASSELILWGIRDH